MVVAGYWYGRISDPGKGAVVGNGAKVGKIVTPFMLKRLDDTAVTVGKIGKVTVINFWATWCTPCQEEMPELENFAQNNQQNVNFYAVDVQESPKLIRDFASNSQYRMNILLDNSGEIARNFEISTLPTTVIINKHGMIKYRKSGAMTRDELEGIINSL
jgi:thiol-disulfide isomerase/thioredoxin